MNKIGICLLLFWIVGCGNSKNSAEKGVVNDTNRLKEDTVESLGDNIEDSMKYLNWQVKTEAINHSKDSLDSVIIVAVEKLQARFDAVPYYFEFKNRRYFIVAKSAGKQLGEAKDTMYYGIVNDSFKTVLIPCKQKIYNPGLTALNCLELKRDNMLGLFSLETHVILEPQFEYIMPVSNIASQVCYGLKDGEWWQIIVGDDYKVKPFKFNAFDAYKTLRFDVTQYVESMMFETKWALEGNSYTADALIMTPSYLEVLNIFPKINSNLISGSSGFFEFGIGQQELTVQTYGKENESPGFFTRFLTESVAGRSDVLDSRKVVVFDKKTQHPYSKELHQFFVHPYLCNQLKYEFIEDSLIEFVRTMNTNEIDKTMRYNYEPKFSYYKVLDGGGTQEIESNRYFPFTEFVEIDASYLSGCFSKKMTLAEFEKWKAENPNYQGDLREYPPHLVTEHLGIADLDIMRNEIYAIHGYKFKTDKWKKYFEQFDWYKPKYDAVDNELSDIEKANIKFILKKVQEMKNREEEFTKPSIGYVPGGWA